MYVTFTNKNNVWLYDTIVILCPPLTFPSSWNFLVGTKIAAESQKTNQKLEMCQTLGQGLILKFGCFSSVSVQANCSSRSTWAHANRRVVLQQLRGLGSFHMPVTDEIFADFKVCESSSCSVLGCQVQVYLSKDPKHLILLIHNISLFLVQFSSTSKSSVPTEFVWVKSSWKVFTLSISYLRAHACGRRWWPLRLCIDVEFVL